MAGTPSKVAGPSFTEQHVPPGRRQPWRNLECQEEEREKQVKNPHGCRSAELRILDEPKSQTRTPLGLFP
eukprot:c3017_g1_i2 orf=3-209(-)